MSAAEEYLRYAQLVALQTAKKMDAKPEPIVAVDEPPALAWPPDPAVLVFCIEGAGDAERT